MAEILQTIFSDVFLMKVAFLIKISLKFVPIDLIDKMTLS